MALFTSDVVTTAEHAHAVVQRYFRRWAVEDGHRLLKDRFSLENVRALTWRRLRRVVFLAHVAYAFMSWLVHVRQARKLAARARSFGRVPTFLYYRLHQMLGEHLAP